MNVPTIQQTGQATIGLISLIREAVGLGNLHNIDEVFTSEQFRLVESSSAHKGKPSLIPCFDDETGYQVRNRILSQRYTLGNTIDLARYMINNLVAMKKFAGVLAMSDDSQWECPESRCAYVSYAFAGKNCRQRRSFGLFRLSSKFSSKHAVIVFKPEASSF